MEFDLGVYFLIGLFFVAELLAAKWMRFKPLRYFMVACAVRDGLMFIAANSTDKMYYNCLWYSRQAELVLLSGIIGYICTLPEPKTWKWRALQLLWAPIPAIKIIQLSWTYSPLTQLPESMVVYLATASGIIVVTGLIGGFGLLKGQHRRACLATAVLAIPVLVTSGWTILTGEPSKIYLSPLLWMAAVVCSLAIAPSGISPSPGPYPPALEEDRDRAGGSTGVHLIQSLPALWLP